jgi:hypothetical protein
MRLEDKKEAYRIFFMVKGHINTSEKTILDSYDGYFRRLWGNHENVYHEEGFEEVWQKYLDSQQ